MKSLGKRSGAQAEKLILGKNTPGSRTLPGTRGKAAANNQQNLLAVSKRPIHLLKIHTHPEFQK